MRKLLTSTIACFIVFSAQGESEGIWSLQPVKRPEVPNPDATLTEIRNPIDAFVQERLGADNLKPSPEADRRTLIRRLSFDFEIKGKLSWKLAPNSNWAIKPAMEEVVLQPEEEKTLRFTIYRATPDKKLSKAPLPKLDLSFNDQGKKLDLDMLLEIPLER